MNDVSDIRDALAQLDRRLGEIRQHVGRLLQDEERPTGGPGAVAEEAAPEPLEEASPPPMQPPPPPEPGVGDRDIADAQIQRLRELREELLRGTRELVHSYERQLDALEASFAPAPPPAPVFEGTVSLVVTNVTGVAVLAEVEAAVRGVGGVERAAVSRYSGQEASIDLTLARPVELVAPLSDALPKGSAIRAITADEITVELGALGSD